MAAVERAVHANPFTPSFGKLPPLMAGRDDVIAEVARAYEVGFGDPNLATLLVGARGTGKTALMLQLQEEAARRGWVCASTTALPGLLDDLYERAVEAAKHLVEPKGDGAKLSGIGVGGVLSLEWKPAVVREGNWRSRMTRLVEGLNERGTGLLLVVDEVQPSLDEIKVLAATYQHFVGENRKVALLMAGLPGAISSLLRDKSVSFLRRASKYRLGRIADSEVEDAFRRTVEGAGRTVSVDALGLAVDAIAGFPYMMQLVGFRMWGRHPERASIDAGDAREGIVLAQRDLEERVLEPTYYDLSRGDVRFLRAMLEDARESELTSIAKRLDEGSNYVSTYKRRLLEQGVIGERGSSRVAFELPGFKEYLERRGFPPVILSGAP